MHIPRLTKKLVFWCLALIALVEFALLLVASPFFYYPVRRGFAWVPMIFNSPDKMEPAPFWHYGKETSESVGSCLIAHAGAAIENNTYTNSREALQNAKKLGYRFVEFDLQALADGTIVGAHDVIPAELQSWEKFSAHPIKGKFTPIALPEIRDFFRNNPDMWLVTDKISKKEDLEKFLEIWGGGGTETSLWRSALHVIGSMHASSESACQHLMSVVAGNSKPFAISISLWQRAKHI